MQETETVIVVDEAVEEVETAIVGVRVDAVVGEEVRGVRAVAAAVDAGVVADAMEVEGAAVVVDAVTA